MEARLLQMAARLLQMAARLLQLPALPQVRERKWREMSSTGRFYPPFLRTAHLKAQAADGGVGGVEGAGFPARSGLIMPLIRSEHAWSGLSMLGQVRKYGSHRTWLSSIGPIRSHCTGQVLSWTCFRPAKSY